MMRGVECADEGKGSESVPPVPPPIIESAALWESVIPIDPLAPFIYDGCTNIHFPIHTSVKFAHQVGLPGIIHQGTATLAVAIHNILNKEAGGDPKRLATVYCRFSGMVLPGSAIRVYLTVKRSLRWDGSVLHRSQCRKEASHQQWLYKTERLKEGIMTWEKLNQTWHYVEKWAKARPDAMPCFRRRKIDLAQFQREDGCDSIRRIWKSG